MQWQNSNFWIVGDKSIDILDHRIPCAVQHPGLYPLDARSNSPTATPVVTTRNVTRHGQMSPGGNLPWLKATNFDEWQDLARQPQSHLWGGATPASRSDRSVSCPKGTTRVGSGMPSLHTTRTWQSAKHKSSLERWFYPLDRLTDSSWPWGHLWPHQGQSPASLSSWSALSLQQQLRTQRIFREKETIYICLDLHSSA